MEICVIKIYVKSINSCIKYIVAHFFIELIANHIHVWDCVACDRYFIQYIITSNGEIFQIVHPPFFAGFSNNLCFSFATVWLIETPQCRSDNTPNFSHETSLFIAALKRQIRLVKGIPTATYLRSRSKWQHACFFSHFLSLSPFLLLPLSFSLSSKGVLSRSLRNSPRERLSVRIRCYDICILLHRYRTATANLIAEGRKMRQGIDPSDKSGASFLWHGTRTRAQVDEGRDWLAGHKSAG